MYLRVQKVSDLVNMFVDLVKKGKAEASEVDTSEKIGGEGPIVKVDARGVEGGRNLYRLCLTLTDTR